MYRSIFVFSVVMYWILSVFPVGAYDVEGIVYDYDRTPLVDATIRLLTIQRVESGRDFTNARGEYRIRNVAGGSYTMEITKMGMKKVTMDISVGGPYYQATVYKDVYLNELIRFESVKPSELKGLFLPDNTSIPLNAFSYYVKGLKKLEKKKYNTALKHFRKALDRYPEFSRCYTHIGDIQIVQGKADEAEKSYLEAIRLNELDPFPKAGLGQLLVNQSKYDEAHEYLSAAIELDPARAENYYLFGKALYHMDRKEEAEKYIMQGLMINPRQSGDARLILADLYFEQQQFTKSRDMLDAYLRENPFAENKKQIQLRIQELEALIAARIRE